MYDVYDNADDADNDAVHDDGVNKVNDEHDTGYEIDKNNDDVHRRGRSMTWKTRTHTLIQRE